MAVKKKAGRPKGSTEDLPRVLSAELSKLLSQGLVGFMGSWQMGGLDQYTPIYRTERVAHYLKLKILEHPQVKAGITLCQALVGSLKWWFELKGQEDINEYVMKILESQWYNIVECIIMAKCFGFAACEKVFEIQTWEGKGDYIAYKDIKFLDPSSVVMHIDKNERYAGFSQPNLNVDKRIPLEKTFWLAHNPKQGLVINKHHPQYGHADIDTGTFTHWYNNMIVWQMFLRYVGKRVSPPVVGSAPWQKKRYKKEDGSWAYYDLMKTLHETLQKLTEGSVLVVPSIPDERGKNQVTVSLLESQQQTEEFLKVLYATGEQLFYSILVPPSIFEKPKSTTGSYAMITSQVEMFLEYLNGVIIPEAMKQIYDQLIEPMVKLQFGDTAPCPELKYSLLTEAMRKMLADQLVVMAKAGKWVADINETCHELGIPKPIKVDPEGSASGKEGDDHDERTPGKKDPDRVGEDV